MINTNNLPISAKMCVHNFSIMKHLYTSHFLQIFDRDIQKHDDSISKRCIWSNKPTRVTVTFRAQDEMEWKKQENDPEIIVDIRLMYSAVFVTPQGYSKVDFMILRYVHICMYEFSFFCTWFRNPISIDSKYFVWKYIFNNVHNDKMCSQFCRWHAHGFIGSADIL